MTFCSLFEDISETFSGTLLVELFGGVIFMSTAIFQTEMVTIWSWNIFLLVTSIGFFFQLKALRHLNLFIVTVLNVIAISTANLYLYCFGGSVVTENCGMYADILFESDWYKMPIRLQKYYILMIANTQRPIHLEGHGLVRLSMEAFGRVNIEFSIKLLT